MLLQKNESNESIVVILFSHEYNGSVPNRGKRACQSATENSLCCMLIVSHFAPPYLRFPRKFDTLGFGNLSNQIFDQGNSANGNIRTESKRGSRAS